jgi:hypothetical protein
MLKNVVPAAPGEALSKLERPCAKKPAAGREKDLPRQLAAGWLGQAAVGRSRALAGADHACIIQQNGTGVSCQLDVQSAKFWSARDRSLTNHAGIIGEFFIRVRRFPLQWWRESAASKIVPVNSLRGCCDMESWLGINHP